MTLTVAKFYMHAPVPLSCLLVNCWLRYIKKYGKTSGESTVFQTGHLTVVKTAKTFFNVLRSNYTVEELCRSDS